MSTPILIALIILLLLLLLLLLWLLRARLRHQWPFPPAYPVEEFVLLDQVVIAGRSTDIESVFNNPEVKRLVDVIQPIHRLEFNRDNFPAEALKRAGLIKADTDIYVIGLYKLLGEKSDEKDLQAALDAIHRAAENAPGGRLDIYAEPNRVTGDPGDPVPGPWDPEPGGCKGTGPADIGSADEGDFAHQWAFDMIGLPGYQAHHGVTYGENVTVAVFDTSPLKAGKDGKHYSWAMSAPFGPLKLTAQDIDNYADSPLVDETPQPGDKLELNYHGLFVSGLVHAVAPASTLRLYKVLEANRHGSMFRLMVGVYAFLRDVVAPMYAAADGQRAVMNFSLGIRIPPEDAKNLQEIHDIFNAMDIFWHLMNLARLMNVTVASAAGNESDKFTTAQPMNFPALLSTGKPETYPGAPTDPETVDPEKQVIRLDNALGVAACTMQRTRSCFSNKGSIAAPGGNGEKRELVIPDIRGFLLRSFPALIHWLGSDYYRETALSHGLPVKSASISHGNIHFAVNCTPHQGSYSGSNCQFGVIGPVLGLDDNETAPLRYGYWAGTSFATPLVSGVAALRASVGAPDPATVREFIEKTATAPSGRLVPAQPGGPADPEKDIEGLGKGILHIPNPAIEELGAILNFRMN